ncbi:MAG: ROK family protein [Thermoleophilia bacterium]|nr:ROK family protein [Thermoleophilia bacterium]
MEANAASGAVIGVDLGGTKLMAGLFDSSDTLVARERVEVVGFDSDRLVAELVGTVNKLVAESSEPVRAVGFGVPTTIDQRTGTAVLAANLPIADLPLRDILQDRTGLAAFIDNDANVAALAEQRLGAGAGRTQDLIMITLGTGFGGGIIAGGRIVRGAIGAGAELGHMSIDFDGPPCVAPNCPGVGCIETFVSGSALARDAAAYASEHPDSPLGRAVASGEPARGETVLALAKQGDAACIAMFERLGERLGVALANLVNIFNPGMIALGGGLTPALEIVLPIAERLLVERALPPGNEFVDVVPASFGPDAGMVGAALMARDGLDGRLEDE